MLCHTYLRERNSREKTSSYLSTAYFPSFRNSFTLPHNCFVVLIVALEKFSFINKSVLQFIDILYYFLSLKPEIFAKIVFGSIVVLSFLSIQCALAKEMFFIPKCSLIN